MLTQTV